MKPQALELPDLWPEGPELKLVNQDTFDPTLTMKALNWKGVSPINRAGSIRKRQDTLKLLMGSKDLRKFVQNTQLSVSDDYNTRTFFNEYGSKSSFIKTTETMQSLFASALHQSKNELTTDHHTLFLEQFSKQVIELKNAEDSVIEAISPEIEKIYSYTGVVTFNTAYSKEKKELKTSTKHKTHGYRNYAFYENDGFLIGFARSIIELYEVAGDSKKEKFLVGFLKTVGFLPLYLPALIIMSFVEKYRNDILYTDKTPETVIKELQRLHDNFVGELSHNLVIGLNDLGVDMDVANKAYIVKTQFQFTLNPSAGFKARLIDSKVELDQEYAEEAVRAVKRKKKNGFGEIGDSFLDGMAFDKGVSLYSMIMRAIFQRRAQKLAVLAARKALNLPLQVAFEHALTNSKHLLSVGSRTMSEGTYQDLMDEVKYTNITNTIAGMGLKQTWREVIAFRNRIVGLFSEFKKHANLADSIIAKREEYSDLPFCFPTVLDDNKNMVTFNNLVPLHLIGRKDTSSNKVLTAADLRRITGLPALNGRIVSITGQNGGGKTATEVELINALYQAHSGLPVFAEHFSFNTKDVVAMVFVERGAGSMLELLMKKLTTIAEEIERNPTNKIVIVIDELLTGTQEDTGYELGRKYLDMLARKGCSVLFVTQITALAEYSKNNLNALCYYFDANGDMKPGIGKGNAEVLAENVGLAKYLK